MESIRVILTQFTDETISIFLAVLVIVFAALIAYWVYNRRKFHQLSHQIPASVVKNYLDSIIANSTALKSSNVVRLEFITKNCLGTFFSLLYLSSGKLFKPNFLSSFFLIDKLFFYFCNPNMVH